MEENKKTTTGKCKKKIKCPLCDHLLFKVEDKGDICLEARCIRCKNVFDITIKGNHIEFENDKIKCSNII